MKLEEKEVEKSRVCLPVHVLMGVVLGIIIGGAVGGLVGYKYRESLHPEQPQPTQSAQPPQPAQAPEPQVDAVLHYTYSDCDSAVMGQYGAWSRSDSDFDKSYILPSRLHMILFPLVENPGFKKLNVGDRDCFRQEGETDFHPGTVMDINSNGEATRVELDDGNEIEGNPLECWCKLDAPAAGGTKTFRLVVNVHNHKHDFDWSEERVPESDREIFGIYNEGDEEGYSDSYRDDSQYSAQYDEERS